METDATMQPSRLAIIGGGSSGLITLKNALEQLPDREICCFEKSDDIVGCWGNPPPGFISTSTRYTTQFACFQQFSPTVQKNPDAMERRAAFADFFCDGDYGTYLHEFADAFELRPRIQLQSEVTSVRRKEQYWELTIDHRGQCRTERFDAVVFCTGLANRVQSLKCDVETLTKTEPDQMITGRRIVVIGGGESGVDMAYRLADPSLQNEVFLSLRTGVRVSPRYHPIRGVPSDFLRNRLLLSFHPVMRNTLGEWFVRFRIACRGLLERLYPASKPAIPDADTAEEERRRYWDLKLTAAARDQLFNVYHNKSDAFLDAVGTGRIRIIGPSTDQSHLEFEDFDRTETIAVNPDLVVPAIGYQSGLGMVTNDLVCLSDFFLGCQHVGHDSLFAVGYARPVIGNIPTISEMQARYVCGLLAGQLARDADIQAQHEHDRQRLLQRFPKLDSTSVYPVEMFPYCDRLARRMGCDPSLVRLGSLFRWARMMLSPATTIHYNSDYHGGQTVHREPVYLPWTLTAIMLLLKPVDWVLKCVRPDRLR